MFYETDGYLKENQALGRGYDSVAEALDLIISTAKKKQTLCEKIMQ